jgi:hypothetical protein
LVFLGLFWFCFSGVSVLVLPVQLLKRKGRLKPAMIVQLFFIGSGGAVKIARSC